MDGRREPRFEIYAPAKLALLDSPERELVCLLLDISATGLKFVADESVAPDEVVALEVEDHLLLADVRYSQPRGDKFVIGAERIHAVEKAALPQDKTKAEQIRFVVEDYRSRIRRAIAGEKALVRKQEPELPLLHRDQVIEAAVQRLLEQWAQEPEGSAQEGTLRAAIVERAAERVAERIPTPPPVVERPQFTDPQQVIASPPAMARPLFTAPPPEIAQPRRSSWRLPLAIAGAIAMVAFTGSAFWSFRKGVAANSPHPLVVAAKSSRSIEAKPAASPAPPAPAAVTGTRHAEIRVTEPVWVYAVSDGKEVFQKLLAKDETRQIDFAERALVRVGNAGGVEISVDGQSLGPLGQRGQIRALEITPGGHRFVPLSSVDSGKN